MDNEAVDLHVIFLIFAYEEEQSILSYRRDVSSSELDRQSSTYRYRLSKIPFADVPRRKLPRRLYVDKS